MKKEINFVFPPDTAFDAVKLRLAILKKEGFPPHAPLAVKLLRRSIDARQRDIKVNITAEIALNEPLPPFNTLKREYQDVSKAQAVIVVGCGPAGMFAALRLIELGMKPIVLERGKDVRARRRDLAAINKDHTVNPESNYCFGEGGAGTYSDGKLYTRSHKRGHIRDILETLVEHGAPTDILIDSHPHIGTNKLPQIVADLRQSILAAGGEVRFETKVADFIYKEGHILGVVTASGEEITGDAVILATGHSARDIFELLHEKQIKIEAKPFALGVRVEHPQSLIDKIQYRCEDRGDYLPAASYALVHQAETKAGQKGVFSFCMCPGGFIVPSATAPGEVVVNGMSPSRRDSKYANSGVVVEVGPADWKKYGADNPLAAMLFQQEIEQRACALAGGGQTAPAQLLEDFVFKRPSKNLLPTSYQPGLCPKEMDEVLPEFIADALRQAFQAFGKSMKGYLSPEAQIVGVESRTSSPVRIPRDGQTLEHPEAKGLFPCGEGAGYAGGIVSAAMDGQKCAEAVAVLYGKKGEV